MKVSSSKLKRLQARGAQVRTVQASVTLAPAAPDQPPTVQSISIPAPDLTPVIDAMQNALAPLVQANQQMVDTLSKLNLPAPKVNVKVPVEEIVNAIKQVQIQQQAPAPVPPPAPAKDIVVSVTDRNSKGQIRQVKVTRA